MKTELTSEELAFITVALENSANIAQAQSAKDHWLSIRDKVNQVYVETMFKEEKTKKEAAR